MSTMFEGPPLAIRDVTPEENDKIMSDIIKITNQLFSFNEECSFQQLINLIQTFIKSNPVNEGVIQRILTIYLLIRPKQEEFLTKIENSISIFHISNNEALVESFKKCFNGYYSSFLSPFIFLSMSLENPILPAIENDQLQIIQEMVSKEINFYFSQEIEIPEENNDSYEDHFFFDDKYINLLEIAAYTGSVQCFKYFMLNNVKFTENVCAYSIAGGNTEIIHILENNYEQQNFSKKNCFTMSIIYITDMTLLTG